MIPPRRLGFGILGIVISLVAIFTNVFTPYKITGDIFAIFICVYLICVLGILTN